MALPDFADNSRIVFVDAHIGALVVPIALKSGSRDIVAFEPSQTNHRLLSMNLSLNGLQAIEVHRVAAGDAPATVRFAHNPFNSGSSFPPKPRADREQEDGDEGNRQHALSGGE